MSTYSTKKPSSRREFLKAISTASAALAGSALSGSAIARAIEHKPRYGMLIDTRRCVGCHACSISCRSENNVPENHHRSWVEYTEKGTFPDATLNFLPRLCNQCSTPQCTSVCPTNATYIRDDGIVVIDPEICIGCKYCIQACPYDARFINSETGAAACLACHGPTGRGNPAAKYPALQGQHAAYTAKQLNDYAAGTRKTDGKTSIMRDIAARLSKEDIAALSSYVQGLR